MISTRYRCIATTMLKSDSCVAFRVSLYDFVFCCYCSSRQIDPPWSARGPGIGMLYEAADVPPEVGLGVKPWLVPPARMSRRSLYPNPEPNVWVPWFRCGGKTGAVQSYNLVQVMLQVRIYEGDVDFTSPGSAAAGTYQKPPFDTHNPVCTFWYTKLQRMLWVCVFLWEQLLQARQAQANLSPSSTKAPRKT